MVFCDIQMATILQEALKILINKMGMKIIVQITATTPLLEWFNPYAESNHEPMIDVLCAIAYPSYAYLSTHETPCHTNKYDKRGSGKHLWNKPVQTT